MPAAVGLAGGRRGTRCAAGLQAQHVGRALHALAAAVEDVGVDHGGADAPVAEELLNGPDVVAADQKVSRERMTESVARRRLRDSGGTNGSLDGSLDRSRTGVEAAELSGFAVPGQGCRGKDVLLPPLCVHFGYFLAIASASTRAPGHGPGPSGDGCLPLQGPRSRRPRARLRARRFRYPASRAGPAFPAAAGPRPGRTGNASDCRAPGPSCLHVRPTVAARTTPSLRPTSSITDEDPGWAGGVLGRLRRDAVRCADLPESRVWPPSPIRSFHDVAVFREVSQQCVVERGCAAPANSKTVSRPFGGSTQPRRQPRIPSDER